MQAARIIENEAAADSEAATPEANPASAGIEAPPRLARARALLREVFGYDDFRPGQGDVVASVLAGRDTLAVMPTGGGKSMCYQVPALLGFVELAQAAQQAPPDGAEGLTDGLGDGLTLVICPLVSLMKDQMDSVARRFRQRGEEPPVAALHSRLPARERREIESRVLSGDVKILYVAPERLRSLEFAMLLKRAHKGRGVSLVVVDEAHCLSEWGQSFRPEYLYVRAVVEDLGNKKKGEARRGRPPVLALTATADPRVREDVADLLGLREGYELILTGFDRPNLSYTVRELPAGAGPSSPVGVAAIEAALSEGETPAIVYGGTRRACEELAAKLAKRGVRAEAYHAGMKGDERDRVQGLFMDDELPVIVATVAFGMGVDKPNVRHVVHAGAPASIPAYVQEAGRAGRDGQPASCTVLFSAEDLDRRKEISGFGSTTAEDAAAFFDALLSTAVPDGAPNGGAPSEFTAGSSGSPATLRATPTLRELSGLGNLDPEGDAAADALRALEAIGRVKRRYNVWASVRLRDVAPEGPEDSSLGKPEGPTRRVLAVLRDSAEGSLALPELARRAFVSPATAQVAVSRLLDAGALKAATSGTLADVLVKPGPLTAAEIAQLRERLENRSRVQARHLDDVELYASPANGCRRATLLRYFGDATASRIAPCDGCDVCRSASGDANGPDGTNDAPGPRPPQGPPTGPTHGLPTLPGLLGKLRDALGFGGSSPAAAGASPGCPARAVA